MELADFGEPRRTETEVRRPYEMIKINHQSGQWELVAPNRNTAYSFGKTLDVVMLGLVRSRVLWPGEHHHQIGGRRPICQSPDSTTGYTDMQFPFSDAGNPRIQSSVGVENRITIKCENCSLRKWNGKEPPRCNHTWNVPMVIRSNVIVDDPGVQLTPFTVHMVAFSKSAVRELENYMTPFRDSRTPLYTAYTRMKLSRVERGGTDRYSVPSFETAVDGNDTPLKLGYRQFSEALHKCTEFLTTPPDGYEDGLAPIAMGSANPS